MTILYSALLLGLMGSFHCVGMCGPIALSLPSRGDSILQKIIGGILWTLGRIFTYSVMGGFFGLIGIGFKMVGFQQIISVAAGVMMLLYVLTPSLFKHFSNPVTLNFFRPVRLGMQKLFQGKSSGALFLIGILNGLLPCGMVYMAIAGAIGTSDWLMSVLYMALFGLGTLPMLLVVSLLGNFIGQSFREKINKIVPVTIVLIGLLFILRGLSLGIPYLSPPKEKLTPGVHMEMGKMDQEKAVEHSCCQPEEKQPEKP